MSRGVWRFGKRVDKLTRILTKRQTETPLDPSKGDWKLHVRGLAKYDEGTLNSWALRLRV